MLLTSKPLPTPGDEIVAMALPFFALVVSAAVAVDLSEKSHAPALV
jgi:hypothetical protein